MTWPPPPAGPPDATASSVPRSSPPPRSAASAVAAAAHAATDATRDAAEYITANSITSCRCATAAHCPPCATGRPPTTAATPRNMIESRSTYSRPAETGDHTSTSTPPPHPANQPHPATQTAGVPSSERIPMFHVEHHPSGTGASPQTPEGRNRSDLRGSGRACPLASTPRATPHHPNTSHPGPPITHSHRPADAHHKGRFFLIPDTSGHPALFQHFSPRAAKTAGRPPVICREWTVSGWDLGVTSGGRGVPPRFRPLRSLSVMVVRGAGVWRAYRKALSGPVVIAW
jgi:hypothetical protein